MKTKLITDINRLTVDFSKPQIVRNTKTDAIILTTSTHEGVFLTKGVDYKAGETIAVQSSWECYSHYVVVTAPITIEFNCAD